MITVNIRQAKKLLRKAINADIPAILMGTPGIGKTSCPKQVAAELGIGCVVEDGSSLDPVDVRGVLIPDMKTRESFFTRPAIFPGKDAGKKGLLVIDELGGCAQATQKALQTILLERRSGSHRLPQGWLPVGTANYAADGAGAYTLLTSLEDRGIVMNVVSDPQIWKEDFAIPQGINHRIISFINWRPECLNTFAKRNKGDRGKGFASERSWEKLSRLLDIGLDDDDDILLSGAAGCVSEGVAVEFAAYLKVHKSLPNIKKIYRGSNDIPKDDEPGIMYALTGALVSYLGRPPEELSKTMAIERFIEYSMLLPAEFAILAVKDAFHLHSKEIVISNNFRKVFTKKYGAAIVSC